MTRGIAIRLCPRNPKLSSKESQVKKRERRGKAKPAGRKNEKQGKAKKHEASSAPGIRGSSNRKLPVADASQPHAQTDETVQSEERGVSEASRESFRRLVNPQDYPDYMRGSKFRGYQ
jgi:hypothetical protein